MRNFYDRFTMNYNFSFLAIYVLLLSGTIAHAQVIKEFTPRTSTHTPNREIYTLKGDFTLIGNTNLSIDSNPDARIDNNRNNGTNNPTYYVDVDSDSTPFARKSVE